VERGGHDLSAQFCPSGAGAHPLHLALVFNLSHTTASNYAASAQNLLDDQLGRSVALDRSHRCGGTGRPRIAAGRSMAGAVFSTDCGSANRPVRDWVESWACAKARLCSASSSGSRERPMRRSNFLRTLKVQGVHAHAAMPEVRRGLVSNRVVSPPALALTVCAALVPAHRFVQVEADGSQRRGGDAVRRCPYAPLRRVRRGDTGALEYSLRWTSAV
jgi:hypothetical protein